MIDMEIQSVYPISWIIQSPAFIDFMKKSLMDGNGEFIVADFASGEHDRVPSFFISVLPELLKLQVPPMKETYVYSIDLHALRLDSLLGKHEESHLIERARVVQARLQSMDHEAFMRPAMIEYIDEHPDAAIWLDDFLIGENRFPPECIDLGVFNNDVVGYLKEYYEIHGDVAVSLQKVRRLIRTGGLLVVTMPCSLYVVDNFTPIEESGFLFLEGVDIELSTKKVTFVKKRANPKTLSRLGYYTILLFNAI